LHSDDVLAESSTISRAMCAFADPTVDAVYGDLVYVDRATGERTLRYWEGGVNSRLALLLGWMPPHPTFMMRRSRYLEWGGYDERFRISGDYEALLRYLWKQRAHCVRVPGVMVRMRIGGVSNRTLAALWRKFREDMRALRINGLPRLPTALIKPLRKLQQFWLR